MANQVKFYTMSAEKYNSESTQKNASALYFISDTHQIYKGSELYGAANIFQAEGDESASVTSITNMVRGDIAVGYSEGACVYDGETWQPICMSQETAEYLKQVKEVIKFQPAEYDGFDEKVASGDLVKDDDTGNYYVKDDESKTPVADENGHALDSEGNVETVSTVTSDKVEADTIDAGDISADNAEIETAEIGKADIGEATFADGEKVIIKEQVVKTENVPYEKTVEELDTLIADPESGYTKDEDGNYLKDGDKVADKDGNALDENGEIVTNEVTDSEGQPVMEEKDTTLPDYIKETVKQDVIDEVRDADTAEDEKLATELAIRKAIDAAMKEMELNWRTIDDEGNDVEWE